MSRVQFLSALDAESEPSHPVGGTCLGTCLGCTVREVFVRLGSDLGFLHRESV